MKENDNGPEWVVTTADHCCCRTRHRTRWQTYTRAEREKLIHYHPATVFEDFCRAQHPHTARYWEANVEFDYVRHDRGRAVVSEVKFKKLSAAERRQLENRLAAGWQHCALAIGIYTS